MKDERVGVSDSMRLANSIAELESALTRIESLASPVKSELRSQLKVFRAELKVGDTVKFNARKVSVVSVDGRSTMVSVSNDGESKTYSVPRSQVSPWTEADQRKYDWDERCHAALRGLRKLFANGIDESRLLKVEAVLRDDG